MPYRQRRLQLAEIFQQSSFAMMAYHDAAMAVRDNDTERLWYSLHALMAAAGHLNRLLWPPAGSNSSHAAGLRSTLEIGPSSPLAQPEIAETHDPAALVEAAGSGSFDPDRARVFDPASSILTFYGVVIEAQPLLAAIAELRNRAAAELQHMREIV
jgi:hypothetical protein